MRHRKIMLPSPPVCWCAPLQRCYIDLTCMMLCHSFSQDKATTLKRISMTISYRNLMKCIYVDGPNGCQQGCTSQWIKCHRFFDSRGCEYLKEDFCFRGWHYHTKAEYNNAIQLRLRRQRRGNSTGRRCLLYTSPSPRDATLSRMPSSA